MTEYDRGAYTPHADAPLAFDARGPRDRGPLPMTLVASGVVLLVIVAALFLAYRGGVRGGNETPRPVGEPVGPIKAAPAPGAASATAKADPSAGLDVYAAQNVPDSKPNFAPAPEQPAARPAPAQLRVQTVAPPPVRIEAPAAVTAAPAAAAASRTAIRPGVADEAAPPVTTTAAPAPPKVSRPVQTASATPAPLRAAAARDVAPASTVSAKAPAVKAAAEKPVAAKPAAAEAPGGSAVQIGAFSSRELADKGYADVSGLMSGSMGGKGRHVEPVAHDGKTVFRTTVTGFADHAAAKAFCASLSAKGHTCFVKARASEG